MKKRIFAMIAAAAAMYAPAQENFQDVTPGERTVSDSSQQIADKIIKSRKPVVVDFWAVWCAPCRMLNPILANLEKKYKGKVEFVKVNVDRHRQIAAYFRVQGIPAIFIISDSTVRKAIVGLQPEAAYSAAIDETLALSGLKKKKAVPDTSSESVPKKESGGPR